MGLLDVPLQLKLSYMVGSAIFHRERDGAPLPSACRRVLKKCLTPPTLSERRFRNSYGSGFLRLLLLTLAVAHLGHNLVHRSHDGRGSLFRNSVIAILNDNLFPIRGQASEFGL